MIGTIGVGFVDEPLAESSLTTPDPVSLQREVRALLDAGAQAIAMEVSSIGLEQGRLNGMKVDIALFTNLTRDHLDYHGTMHDRARIIAVTGDAVPAALTLDDEPVFADPRLAERASTLSAYTQRGSHKISPDHRRRFARPLAGSRSKLSCRHSVSLRLGRPVQVENLRGCSA